VGAEVLHPVQIAAPIRHLEAKRTKRAAHREYAPTINADKQAQQATRHEYGTEAASYKGAAGMLDSSLAQALAGIGGSGLKGTAAQQVKSELTARLGDVASSLPYLLAGNREEEGKALSEGRQQLLQDRAAMQKSSASAFNQRLKELRGQGTSAITEQSKHQTSISEDAKKEIGAAVREGERLLAAYPGERPETPEEWKIFEGSIENAEGVGVRGARMAAELLRYRTGVNKAVRSVNPFG
jgi:hypothetical protein